MVLNTFKIGVWYSLCLSL
ncbi:hypothetical protein J5A63_10760 [Prevotella jejuni]|nr:hypothetical protein J5A63_10760 [Prevotella jejuni]